MGKFDGYLLLSDFDGTLSHDEKEFLPDGTKIYRKAISPENCDAIRYFQSEGGLFTLATGRPFHWLKQWDEFFVPNTYIVSFNGAYICDADGKDVLFSRAMDRDFLQKAEEIWKACPDLEWVHFHSVTESVMIKKGEPLSSARLPASVYKMVFYAHKEQSDDYAARIATLLDDRFISMRSWINGIEVQMKGAGKGDAIPRLKKHLGDRARVAIAVGDYENDVDMIRSADIGYAVDNAVPVLKAVADRFTVSNRQSAIAKIIEELGRDC
ncbi:MAG: HAD-IIB family hydrolase [Clostridia bacterium]|nr:HAD-IIB family hydrolase [Clostridia bacterium]